jgi:hypothetical protein
LECAFAALLVDAHFEPAADKYEPEDIDPDEDTDSRKPKALSSRVRPDRTAQRNAKQGEKPIAIEYGNKDNSSAALATTNKKVRGRKDAIKTLLESQKNNSNVDKRTDAFGGLILASHTSPFASTYKEAKIPTGSRMEVIDRNLNYPDTNLNFYDGVTDRLVRSVHAHKAPTRKSEKTVAVMVTKALNDAVVSVSGWTQSTNLRCQLDRLEAMETVFDMCKDTGFELEPDRRDGDTSGQYLPLTLSHSYSLMPISKTFDALWCSM